MGGNPNCEIQFDGRTYKLVPLLNLLRLWAPTAIDRADASMPKSPQEFWDKAMEVAPDETRRALEHVRVCEDSNQRPNPYEVARTLG